MQLSALGAILAAIPAMAAATELKKETLSAFDRYVASTEAGLDHNVRSGAFLWVDQSADRLKRVRAGEVVIEPKSGKGDEEVPGGLVHDWIGAVFIPRATLSGTLAWVQDYDHHKDAHQAEVLDSKLLSRNGNDFKSYLRITKKKVITVVLDTYHDIRYFPLDSTRWYSRSRSTRIAEVDDPGKKSERQVPLGDDHGFLWRLNSYWRFQERDGGVYVECEAVSLTRNVPAGLGWLIEPIIRKLPRESLGNTLRSTRGAVQERVARAARETPPAR